MTLNEMTLNELLKSARRSLLTDGKSRKTLNVYLTYWRYFSDYITELQSRDAMPSDMTTPLVRSYIEHRAQSGVIANTRRLELSALSTLALWLVEAGLIEALPAVKRPRAQPQHRTVPSDTEVFALLDACSRYANPVEAALSHVVLRLLMHTGLRRTELIALTLSDVDIERRRLRVRCGKGGKERFAPVCAELASALAEYRAVRQVSASERLLLVGKLPFGQRSMTRLFADLRARSGQKEKLYLQPHGLRHWFACNARRKGIPLEKLSQILGHVNLSTTQIYLRGLGEDIGDYAEYTATPRAVAVVRDRPARQRQSLRR